MSSLCPGNSNFSDCPDAPNSQKHIFPEEILENVLGDFMGKVLRCFQEQSRMSLVVMKATLLSTYCIPCCVLYLHRSFNPHINLLG